MRARKCDYKGKTISYLLTGKGPTITFLHGFPEAKEIWLEFMTHFRANYQVLAIDLPGLGKTDQLAKTHTMALMADVVKHVWDALGIEASVVIGHSMGGYVGLELLAKSPKMVAGLCLFQSTAAADTEEKKMARLKAVDAAQQDAVKFARSNIEILFAPGNREKFPEAAHELAELASRSTASGIAAALLGMRERKNHTPTVQNTSVPILYLLGEKDPVMDVKTVSQQIEGMNHATLAIIPEMGHLGFIEAKAECLKVLEEWIGNTNPPAV